MSSERKKSTKNLPIRPSSPPSIVNPSINNNFHIIKQKLHFSCSHCSCAFFVLISCSVHTAHADFDFNYVQQYGKLFLL